MVQIVSWKRYIHRDAKNFKELGDFDPKWRPIFKDFAKKVSIEDQGLQSMETSVNPTPAEGRCLTPPPS